MEKLFEIVHEDAGLLVINKAAGLVCHPTKGDVYSSLISRVRLHLGAEAHPQLVNRLDRELRRIWEARRVRKDYLAIVHGHVATDHGTIETALGKDPHSIVAVKDCV